MGAPSAVRESDSIRVRKANAADVAACGPICYEAFTAFNRHHNFPPDFPNVEVANQVLSWMFSHEKFHCLVAELDGKTVGSNCLDERCEIAGVGPITVDPAVQNKSVGRRLMLAVMDRAAEQKASGIRLVQMAFNNRSLSLYTKLGFDPMEPLSVMNGPAIGKAPSGYSARAATSEDLDACDALCLRVHGHKRRAEIQDGIAMGTARVAQVGGQITAYASAIGFFGHAVAETNRDLQALISTAGEFLGPGILVPTRNASLFRWCLEQGLRVVEPATLMSAGLYNQPAGAFLPSITF
ncbi:MAG: GNAT family N-acetyltransferase [Acidobacteria bacterium]|nr:GNAT family N-acetyltransferase [Acidobacteriota bacterium]MBS1866523.1 GNAT family N-acetyltransferase [Acidobacteriota bacterium]